MIPAAQVHAKPPEPPPSAFRIDADNIDRVDYVAAEETVEPESAKAAARMSLVQALYASAEFRFVR